MAPQGPSVEDSDEDLGIGAGDDTPAFADVLNDPRFAKLIEAAVSQRMASMGHAAPAQSGSEAAFAAFLGKFEKIVEARDEQRPGYMKPLSAGEIADRNAGQEKMFALIAECKRGSGEWPKYLIADPEGFHGPSAAGPMLYPPGQEINWRGPPSDKFQPLNAPAMAIYAAYKQWVGEVVSIEELVAAAANEARGGIAIPESALVRAGAEDIQVIDAPLRDMTPTRALGTNGPETRGRPMPAQAGAVMAPQGPVYVEAA